MKETQEGCRETNEHHAMITGAFMEGRLVGSAENELKHRSKWFNRFTAWLKKRRINRLKVEIAGAEVRVSQLKIHGEGPIGYQYTERHLSALVKCTRLRKELEILEAQK